MEPKITNDKIYLKSKKKIVASNINNIFSEEVNNSSNTSIKNNDKESFSYSTSNLQTTNLNNLNNLNNHNNHNNINNLNNVNNVNNVNNLNIVNNVNNVNNLNDIMILNMFKDNISGGSNFLLYFESFLPKGNIQNNLNFKQFFYSLKNDTKKLIIDFFSKNVIQFLSSVQFCMKLAHFYFCLDADDALTLCSNIKISMIIDFNVCDEFLNFLNYVNRTQEKDSFVIQLFDYNLLSKVIFDKSGKNIIIHMFDKFYSNTEALQKLANIFFYLDSNFLNFSTTNFSTYVIQHYVRHFQTQAAYDLSIMNIDNLINNRNGVFVLVAILETHNSQRIFETLKLILKNLEVYTNGKYSSTLMEFVFNNFPESVEYFILNKSKYLLGKILS